MKIILFGILLLFIGKLDVVAQVHTGGGPSLGPEEELIFCESLVGNVEILERKFMRLVDVKDQDFITYIRAIEMVRLFEEMQQNPLSRKTCLCDVKDEEKIKLLKKISEFYNLHFVLQGRFCDRALTRIKLIKVIDEIVGDEK